MFFGISYHLGEKSLNHHTQNRFEAFNDIATAVAHFDPAGVLTYANDEGLRLLGIRSDEHVDLGMLFPDLTELNRVTQKLAERIKGKSAIYQVSFHPPHEADENKLIPISVYAVPDAGPTGEITGSIAVMRDMRVENARTAIHNAIETSRTNEALFSRLVEQLRTIFEFDEFRVTAVSQSRRHLLRMYSTDPEANSKYPFRWWPMPPFVLERLDKYVPEVMEVDKLRAEPEYQDLIKRDAACRKFFESDVKQILNLPIMRGRRIVAFISLDSKTADRYDAVALERFNSLPLAEAFMSARLREQRQRQHNVLKLILKLTKISDDIGEVALELVQHVQRTFGWDHISLFQVEAKNVRLMAQAAKPGARRLPVKYLICRLDDSALTEPQEGRAIAFAIARDKHFVADESRVDGVLGLNAGPKAQGSVLALPITSQGLQWVLHAESHLCNAFAVEEIGLLKLLASDAASIMARAAMFGLKEAVLKSIGDAVFEVDGTGHIRAANNAAAKLLGVKSNELIGQSVLLFIKDEGSRAEWLKRGKSASAELLMQRADGKPISVLLSVSCLPPHFGGQVYVATDLTPHKEVQRLSELKTVFQRAAMEGRVPLSLAASTLQLEATGSHDLKSVLDKVQRYLARADLPLERLMRLFSAEHKLLSKPYADMRYAIHTTLAELPRTILERLQLTIPSEVTPVVAVFDDLQFCIESLISFGVRTMPQSRMLQVSLGRTSSRVRLEVYGDWVPSIELDHEADAMDRWRRKSVSDLTLGNGVIERIASRYGGSYECNFSNECRMAIELPQFIQ